MVHSTRLSPRVVAVNGFNPGPFTLNGTNTYLVGSGPTRILIDTAQGRPDGLTLGLPQWKSELAAVLEAERVTALSDVLITHRHHDHVGGIGDVQQLFPSCRIWKRLPEAGDRVSSFSAIQDGQLFSVDGATLQALYTEGHTSDHCSFVLQEENAIFTGDCVLGQGTAVFENLRQLLSSLNKMLDIRPTGGLYCGHGDYVRDGVAKIKEYLAHRETRDQQILQILAK
ncbi:hypothetical protein HDU91_007084 [Kappamyces sp. JEL0680]|nr:hypothetical protein HDU91_007084 [Kappamyces sp. JEL0680]